MASFLPLIEDQADATLEGIKGFQFYRTFPSQPGFPVLLSRPIMSDTQKPIIAVCGASGAQGGSVVEYLLNDPDHSFRIRGLTRNIDSPKAKGMSNIASFFSAPDTDER